MHPCCTFVFVQYTYVCMHNVCTVCWITVVLYYNLHNIILVGSKSCCSQWNNACGSRGEGEPSEEIHFVRTILGQHMHAYVAHSVQHLWTLHSTHVRRMVGNVIRVQDAIQAVGGNTVAKVCILHIVDLFLCSMYCDWSKYMQPHLIYPTHFVGNRCGQMEGILYSYCVFLLFL